MAWASIDDGSPTDEVWLDRSFDGGQTWANGLYWAGPLAGLAYPNQQSAADALTAALGT